MSLRIIYDIKVGLIGLGLLVALTVLNPLGFFSGALDRAAAGVLPDPMPWLLYALLVALACATALLGFRIEGEYVTFDYAVGLAALFLYGPLPAAWLLVVAGIVGVLGQSDLRRWRNAHNLLREAGVRPLMAMSGGLFFAMTGGRLPLEGLNLQPGWQDPQAAGWVPVLAASAAFFLTRELVRLPGRFSSDGAEHAAWRLLRLEVPVQACTITLGVVLALTFRQPGLLQAILLSFLVLFTCRAVQGMVENREGLARRVEEMRSLNMVGRAICASMQPEDLMAIVYRECRRLLDTSLFYVALHDREKRVLRMELLAEGDQVLEGRDIPLGKGFSGLVFRTRRPLLFRERSQMENHPSAHSGPLVGNVKCESFLWVPIATADRVYGVLSAQHTDARRYSPQTLEAVQVIAHQAAVALENIHLFRKSTTDALTGLYMRTYFEQKLEEQMFKAVRHGYRLSMMVIDLDNFKNINDTLGHAAGDEVLREVGAAIGHSIRAQDVAARYGGDEFVLLLPGINVEVCLEVATRIKGQVQALNFPVLARMGTSRITVSIGIATVAPGEQTDLGSLFETADRALLEAKRTGKNRVLARTGTAS